jgi:glycosyltransferase involved in cell wall biosynthesis
MIQTYCERTTLKNEKFSILIPSWNNLNYLKICIDSIRKNSKFDHQIIVHINEGIDGTLEWIKLQTDINYTYSIQNIGVCYSLNCARSLVKTDYIVYVNDDMYLCPDWDKYLMDEIELIGHKRFFLSATVIEPAASSNCVITKNFGTSFLNFDETSLLNEYKNLSFHDWAGATWPPNIVPTKLWDAVGGYSIEFSPGMYSDPDFSNKLWKAGVRLFKGVSASRAYHFGSKSVSRAKLNNGYYQFINKWGYTSSFLTKKILHIGEIFQGPCNDFSDYRNTSIKQLYKRIISSFKRLEH